MGGKRTASSTRQAPAVALLAVFLTPTAARAGNTDEVNAGIDVTLSGGAVVASTYTGAALWYNPAGIARIKKASLEITGITFQTQIVRVPGFVTIGTDPPTESEGKTVNFTVIPEALTFTIVLKENLKLGIGLFNSSIRRSLLTEEVTTAPDISPEVKAVGGRSSRNTFFSRQRRPCGDAWQETTRLARWHIGHRRRQQSNRFDTGVHLRPRRIGVPHRGRNQRGDQLWAATNQVGQSDIVTVGATAGDFNTLATALLISSIHRCRVCETLSGFRCASRTRA